ncbi:hypothetical protein JCM9279_003381 [Rhodotorula babjevae]
MPDLAALPAPPPPRSPPRAEPPRLAVDVRQRRLVVAAFWAAILVGLPLWWTTTSLERRPLPEQRIQDWAKSWDERIPRSATAGDSADEADSRVVKYSPHIKLVFSLLNQDSAAGGAVLSWDAPELLSRHIRPLLSSLSPLHNFTVETQVQYFAPLAVPLHREEGREGAHVEEHDLRAFVNNAEWNLASGDTLDPVLHFLLFVPSPENRMLRIHDSNGAELTPAFITPQRGGVVIFNPPSSSPDDPTRSAPLALSPADFAPSFRLFASQLRTLLGVPSPSTPRTRTLALAPTPTARERDALIRRRLREAAHDSVDSLEALVTLAGRIGNMRISSEVQARVRAALEALDAAALGAASSPSTALAHAALAQRLASEAYFDPSMLALLYFPDEHKYAVYTPLFGPVAVPLLVALLREVKEWRAGRRRKGAEEDKEEEEVKAGGVDGGGREGEVG